MCAYTSASVYIYMCLCLQVKICTCLNNTDAVVVVEHNAVLCSEQITCSLCYKEFYTELSTGS